MRYPSEVYRPSARFYQGIGELDYPFRGGDRSVQGTGRLGPACSQIGRRRESATTMNTGEGPVAADPVKSRRAAAEPSTPCVASRTRDGRIDLRLCGRYDPKHAVLFV
jgi:hypothetical protein